MTPAVGLTAAFLLCGCKSQREADLEQQISELQSQLSSAQEQIADLKEKAQAVAEASDSLQDQMSRFGTENWRDVVPDAQTASSEVDDAKTELSSAADSDE